MSFLYIERTLSEYAAALLRALPHLFLPFLLLYEESRESFEQGINFTKLLHKIIFTEIFSFEKICLYLHYQNQTYYESLL